MSAEYIGGFGITESDAGSDVMSMQSTAEDKGDHWLLNGSKTWISNASVADLVIYYAYTDRSAGSKGLSAFVVELKNVPGVKTSKLEKMGSHSSPTGEIFLDNCKVPKENILGKPGDGAKIVFSSLNQTRLSAAAGAVGLAQACLDTAIKYCNERKQFGKPIGQFQMNQDMIAQMSTEIEAARLLVYKAAWAKDQGRLEQRPGRGPGQVLRRRGGQQVLQLRHADSGRLRLLHRIPGGPLLPRRPHLLHGRGVGQHLQVDHRPGSAGIPQGQPVGGGRK